MTFQVPKNTSLNLLLVKKSETYTFSCSYVNIDFILLIETEHGQT